MSRSRMPGFVSLLYNHNPFYLISACLFVYGLKLLFRSGTSDVLFGRGAVAYIEPWGLLSSLAGVTLLMAITAVLIVRLGRVWEDARSLLLIVLLMLLAIAVSMDEIYNLLAERENARRHLLLMFGLGTAFCIAVTEGVIRGCQLRLSPLYRLPLMAFLCLFFLWPALLLRELTGFSPEATQRLIVAFPVVAALLTLTLLPAVRKGSQRVKDNGTPWTWPLFPWTPFVFVALAVVFRAYSLTMSYDAAISGLHYWDTTFGLYQLVPFLMGVCVLLLEIGITEAKPRLQNAVFWGTPLLLLLAVPKIAPWHRMPGYSEFVTDFTQQLAAPVYLSLLLLTVFYAYAWWRHVRLAELGLSVCFSASIVATPHAIAHHFAVMDAAHANAWSLVLPAVLLLAVALYRRNGLVFLVAGSLAAAASVRYLQTMSVAAEWQIFAPLHIGLVTLVLTAICFDRIAGTIAREVTPAAWLLTTFLGFVLLKKMSVSVVALGLYAVVQTVSAVIAAAVLNSPALIMVAMLHVLLCGLGAVITGVLGFVQARWPAGTKPVVLAFASFLLAVLISTLKGGLSRRIRLARLIRQRRSAMD